MQLTPQYLSLQGEILLYKRDNAGLPKSGFWLGDCAEAELKLQESKTDYPENYSGQRATALTLYQSVVSGFGFKALQLNTVISQALLRGTEVAQSVTAVTNQVISDATGTLRVGDRFQLRAENVSAVTIEDSTSGTPKTLDEGVDYELDAATGRIKILDVTTNGPFVLPLKADFTPGASNSISLLTNVREEWHLSLVGVNTAVSGNPKGVLDLYRYQFSLPSAMALINAARAEMPIDGTVLADPLKSSSGPLGLYGRIQGFGITG